MATKQGSARKKVVFITGPTGAGKTAISIKLAKKINGEIICCDSMQVYKGMDVLTAQPSKKETSIVEHHLFRIKKPTENFSVAQYRKLALKKIKEIHKRPKIPIFVGGAGLYAQALLDGLFSSPGEDVDLRRRLHRYAEKYSVFKLYKKLKKIDPQAATVINKNDLRRIVRALEVRKLTGKTISELKKSTKGGIWGLYEIDLFCIFYQGRAKLYERINDRVEEMFRKGLVSEVRKLSKIKLSKTASQALGIRQVSDFLEGKCSLDQAKAALKKDTRRYAKRQLSWFRRDQRIRWIPLDGPRNDRKCLTEILIVI